MRRPITIMQPLPTLINILTNILPRIIPKPFLTPAGKPACLILTLRIFRAFMSTFLTLVNVFAITSCICCVAFFALDWLAFVRTWLIYALSVGWAEG